MSTQQLHKVRFNPKLKNYIYIVIGCLLCASIIGIPLGLIWFLGLGQVLSKRYFERLSCELTTHHLAFKKGLFFRIEKTIPLENIQDLTFLDNPILSRLGLRILKIETAGQSNPKGSDMKLMGIQDVTKFKAQVLEQREAITRQQHNQTVQSSDESVELLKEIRDTLNVIKNRLSSEAPSAKHH